MKNKRKIIIIVVCVIAAAAIAVGAGLGYYYSRPERTAEKVLTAVYTVDNAEIQRRREAIDNRTFDTYMRERCDGAVTDNCTEGMIAACALYYGATPAKVESIKFSPIDKATGDTASFQYTAVFDDDSDVKERIGHVVMKKENGKWVRLSWEQAIDEIGDKMLEIRKENGPDSVMFLGSAKFNNQQAYYFRKFAAFWGTNNIDHVARI